MQTVENGDASFLQNSGKKIAVGISQMLFMDFKFINQSFIELVQELNSNELVNVVAVSYPATSPQPLPNFEGLHLPQSIVQYFQEVNGFHLKWENRYQDTTLISGSLVLLPAAEVTKSWNGAIYFDDDTAAANKPFYPIDQFADEACCGVFAGGKKESLHYYAFSSGDEPYNLEINIQEYITLAIAAKCYYYWPLVLKQIVEKESSPMIQKMNDDMAVLFPQFSMERFVDRYKQMRN
jgi:hypothetical protein